MKDISTQDISIHQNEENQLLMLAGAVSLIGILLFFLKSRC